ncbi:MAG TPA: nicotinate-nucleotide adenylyltransferase [Burkholderiaceae bacterium]
MDLVLSPTAASGIARAAAGPIGLLGGSFDPIHAGHLALARAARERLELAEVRFIPAGQPWQKGPTTPAAQRARMVELAIAGEPGFSLDRLEIERPGPTYTGETLRALRAACGPGVPLVWILGSDQLQRLDTWREWERLTDWAHLAVAQRAGAAGALPATLSAAVSAFVERHRASAAGLREQPSGTVVEFAMTPVDCSATEVRALLAAAGGRGDERLVRIVPAAVLEHIRSEKLYR